MSAAAGRMLALSFAMCVSCSETEAPPARDLNEGVDSSWSTDTGSPVLPPCCDAPPFDTTPRPSPDAESVSEPVVPCEGDAVTDATFCPLPPSVCADAEWLVYFVRGACIDGLCKWDRLMKQCSSGCAAGGCKPGPTK